MKFKQMGMVVSDSSHATSWADYSLESMRFANDDELWKLWLLLSILGNWQKVFRQLLRAKSANSSRKPRILDLIYLGILSTVYLTSLCP